MSAFVLYNGWTPAPPGLFNWSVRLGGAVRTVRAKSHQAAKRAFIDYLSACCGDPEGMRVQIMARISEKWRGGIMAKREPI